MKKHFSFKPGLTLALLLIAILMEVLYLFAFTRIDKIVHSDLYKYGLQFSYEWAGKYWAYSNLLINSLIISIILITMAAVSVLIYSRTQYAATRIVSYLCLIAGTAITIFSLYPVSRLDHIIHQDLYNYGLQFSHEWATNYWTYMGLILGLITFISVITITSTTLVFLSARKTLKIHLSKLICPILIALGAMFLALSTMYSLLIPAFIGLGLTFWGAILAYIQTEDHVKRRLLGATALAPIITLNQVMQELQYEGKAIYLPPKYLENQEENRAYVPKQKNSPFPTPEQARENVLFIKSLQGMLITPPGSELTKLFEKTLETSFTRVDLQYLQLNMPKLFVEELEIAQNLDINIENNKVYVKVENSAYQNLTKEVAKFSKVYESLGCPLSSAIACALAKAAGKPIAIEKQRIDEKNKTIEIEYRIIEEQAGK